MLHAIGISTNPELKAYQIAARVTPVLVGFTLANKLIDPLWLALVYTAGGIAAYTYLRGVSETIEGLQGAYASVRNIGGLQGAYASAKNYGLSLFNQSASNTSARNASEEKHAETKDVTPEPATPGFKND